jgi:hypothetical protein
MKTGLSYFSKHDHQSPFMPGQKARPLRLFVDREHLTEGRATQLLDEFAFHEGLVAVTTQGDNPNRIVLTDRRDDMQLAEVSSDAGITYMGVTNVSQWSRLARQPILREGLVLPPGPWNHEAYRLNQYLLTQFANSLHSDAFVTDDPFLLQFRRHNFIPLMYLSSAEAVALIGSFLRSRGDFTIQAGKGTSRTLHRGIFYWVLGRELLPAGWRWFSSIVASDMATSNDLVDLGQSVLKRMEQALKARDRAHWQLLQPHNNETADEAIFYIDVILLSLSAAFDVVARVADVVLELGTKPNAISWNSDRWRRALRAKDQDLDSAMVPFTPHGQVHRLLSLLRNSIHGEGLNTLAVERAGKPKEHLLLLSKADRDELRHLLRELGGQDRWGYQDLADDDLCIRLGTLVEELIPRVASALNELMDLTKVELLPRLEQDTELLPGPPADGVWEEATRLRVRLLGGIQGVEA